MGSTSLCETLSAGFSVLAGRGYAVYVDYCAVRSFVAVTGSFNPSLLCSPSDVTKLLRFEETH